MICMGKLTAPLADRMSALHQAAGMSLTLIRITMRIGMPCAIAAVGALGVFIVIRHIAWMG